MTQKIITSLDDYAELYEWFSNKKRVLVVCGESIHFFTGIYDKLQNNNIKGKIVRFSNFSPNPNYESVLEGVELYKKKSCDAIFAVGGGSAIDVAKCIKAFAYMDGNGRNGEWLNKNIVTNDIPFLVMPTTAGTGSEATRYAVIYYQEKKQSVTSDVLIPETILMDPSVLDTLPIYQKKATLCDALSHGVESYWSINSTVESRKYSDEAIRLIVKYMDGYLANTKDGNAGMLRAAHIAGKAINITQTTAGHAMCYKITGLFGIAHGHAAILCNRALFPWMIENTEKCADKRGKDFLEGIFNDIGRALGGIDAEHGAAKLEKLVDSLMLSVPVVNEKQLIELENSVNHERLSNNPIILEKKHIYSLYYKIFNK